MRPLIPHSLRLIASPLKARPTFLTQASIATTHRQASAMSGPPKHEMAYFPDMSNRLPASSEEFRRVLWTGLYSQVVLMTIPVGGDIGEEVCGIYGERWSTY